MRTLRACAPTRPAFRLKHMAWKVLARGGEAAVRSYSESRRRSPSGSTGRRFAVSTTEARLSQLCRWVLDSEGARCAPYGLRLPGVEIAPARGTAASRPLSAGARDLRGGASP